MTIACCYVSPEGVIFGADSTTSYGLADGPHYFNHAQKVFEIGERSTLAAMFWGLAGLGPVSLRTLIAKLDDDIRATPAATVQAVMERWIAILHQAYVDAYNGDETFRAEVDLARALNAKAALGSADAGGGVRTADEEELLLRLRMAYTMGSCIGGYVLPDRTPAAYFVHVEPQVFEAPGATAIPMNGYQFWGAPNMLQRLLFAADEETRQTIMASGQWNGSREDLDAVLAKNALVHPILPLREAVDFVHTCVQSTIKALKFSHFQQICGGPVELAVISTDRKFRWVRHKVWDAAVLDGAPT